MTTKQNQIDRIEKYYRDVFCQDLILKQNLKNIMQIPKIEKIIISTSSKMIINDKKLIIPALLALQLITGQKLFLTRAKKPLAAFKIRKNQLIGCKVTLRGAALWGFLSKLICIILPRIRDFNGLKTTSFDSQSNFHFGIDNLYVFPELENHFEFFQSVRGINISLIFSTNDKSKASLLVSSLQIPFSGKNDSIV